MTRHAPADLRVDAWPALLTTEMAGAYLQMSEASLRFTAAKFGVAPVETGLSMTRWAKADLDRMIDSLPRRGAEMQPANAPDPAEAALARVRARAKG